MTYKRKKLKNIEYYIKLIIIKLQEANYNNSLLYISGEQEL